MNYQRIYDSFIADRRRRPAPAAPFDVHHVLPRAYGGTDDDTNLIALAADDHLFAHMLLAKIYGGKMIRAIFGMLQNRRYEGRSSRVLYKVLRERGTEVLREGVREANARRGHGPRKGIKHTEEAKAKMRASIRATLNRRGHGPLLGVKMTESGRLAMRKTPEHKAKIGAKTRERFAYYHTLEALLGAG